jgi:broad specificity phosphatase PhoE
MTPRIHLIRHGKGYHQLTPSDGNKTRHVPDLTDEGIEQCKAFNSNFSPNLKVDLLCTSPIRRTIQTAQHCFASHLNETSAPILLLTHAQEAGDVPSDTGSLPAELRKEFGGVINTSMVEDDWNSNEGIYAAMHESLSKRARELRLWLRELEKKDVGYGSNLSPGLAWKKDTPADIEPSESALTGGWPERDSESQPSL